MEKSRVGLGLGLLASLLVAACSGDQTKNPPDGGGDQDAGGHGGSEAPDESGGAFDAGSGGGPTPGGGSTGDVGGGGSLAGGSGGSSGDTSAGAGMGGDEGNACSLRDEFRSAAPTYVKLAPSSNAGKDPDASSDSLELVDDLEDDDLLIPETNGRVGGWWTYSDGVSTITEPLLQVVGSHSVVEVEGERPLSSVAMLGVALNDPPDDGEPAAPYDASDYDGILVHFAGVLGTRIRVSLRTNQVVAIADGGDCDPDLGACEDSYGIDWSFSGDMQELRVPFALLQQKGWGAPAAKDFGETIAIQFQVDGPGDSFDFLVDDVSFYRSGNATQIRVNQLGYLTEATKRAVVADSAATAFSLLDDESAVVFSGSLSAAETWVPSGESAKIADFSTFATPGRYRIQAGSALSHAFRIGGDIFDDVSAALLKAYYFNRASTALTAPYAGVYQRAAGHPDTNVIVHASAASPGRPAASTINAAKGWYDAGDYGKYVVNASVATVTLLLAYEHYPERLGALRSNIPESSSALPDILSEARYNLDWLLKMQDPHDGGVYHELVTQQFASFVLPALDTASRYVLAKTTAASLDFAATMAHAARVYAPFDADFSCAAMQAARAAYEWAEAHPNVAFALPPGFQAGTYDPTEFGPANYDAEFYWAATELYASSGEAAYLTQVTAKAPATIRLPTWAAVEAFGALAINDHAASFPKALRDSAKSAWLTLADDVVQASADSAFRVPMTFFVWGSNSFAANEGLVVLVAHELDDDPRYLETAVDAADYLLGRNGVGVSMITGYGDLSPQHLHHRPSAADNIAAPIPGFLVGGTNDSTADRNGSCVYPSSLPGKAFLDDQCAYASVEVAINWNAPAVYLLNALAVELGDD